MAGKEERDKGRHDDDNDMITMTMLLLRFPPPDGLKKSNNQLNWEDTVGK